MVCKKSKGLSIPVQNYQDYFDALVFNNAQYVEDVIRCCRTSSEVDFLLNHPFDYADDQYNKGLAKHHYKPTVPFHLAVSNSSREVTRVLIANGINAQSVDSNGNNVIHSLITASTYVPEKEAEICEMYGWIKEVLGERNLCELLMSENKDGFRPIEYAAQQGTVLLLQAIFDSRGKYVVREEVRGLFLYRWHDVTEYETGSRLWKSPVHLLTYLQREKLKMPSTSDVITKSVINTWIQAKQHKNLIPVLFWFLLRLSTLVTFLVLDNNTGKMVEKYRENITLYACPDLMFLLPQNKVLAMLIFLSVITTMMILFDIVAAIHYKCSGRYKAQFTVRGHKNLVTNLKFYKITHLLLSVSMLFCTGIYNFVKHDREELTMVYELSVVVIPILCSWSLMYFIQTVPVLGPSIISIQGMLKDMLSFLGLLLIIISPFVHIVLKFVHQNSQQGCIPEFGNVFSASYMLFQIMFNKVELDHYDITNKGILLLIEVVFVFIVAILLINFLVAVMASSAAKTAANRSIMLTINRLAVSTILEERIHWIVPCYYKAMNHMLFSCSNGKVYVLSKTNRVLTLAREK